MNLFTFIGDKGRYDITNHILVPTYKVNNTSVDEAWVDGNKRTHKQHLRNKVVGSFTVYFEKVEEFEDFVYAMSNRIENDRTYDVELYLNNEKQTRLCSVYIDWEPVNDLPYYGIKKRNGYTITVEEP